MQDRAAGCARPTVRLASVLLIVLFAVVSPTRAGPLKECGEPGADLKQGVLDGAGLNRVLAGCGELLQSQPDNPYINFQMGFAFDAGGEDERAIAFYTKAIELKSDFARAYNYRGNLYNRKNDSQRALADQTKAIESDPKDYRNYASRFDANYNLGKYDAAIADMSKVIELIPKEDYLQFYKRGECYEKLGNTDAAISDYRKAATLANGSFPPITNALARLGAE